MPLCWMGPTQVPVETWRTRLWEEALVEAADLRDWPLAERLQRCFKDTRLAHFKLEPGVKVRLEGSMKFAGQAVGFEKASTTVSFVAQD